MLVFLWYSLLAFLIIQTYYVLFIFRPLGKYKSGQKNIKKPVSVIICAKNELTNLKQHLRLVLDQKYPSFEIVLMDDHSIDGTENFVTNLQKEFKNLRYLKASEEIRDRQGKKWALKEAIAKAKYDTVLLTDADCMPSSSLWIQHMVGSINGKTQIVLGIGQYTAQKTWLNQLIQYETLFTAISYLSFALAGKTYMGVGRNLAYSKSLFDLNKINNLELAGGDDDLFIQNVANETNVSICIESAGQTVSKAPQSHKDWINQKTRHYSTSFSYTKAIKASLLLMKSSIYLTNYLLLILFFYSDNSTLAALIFFSRFFLYYLVFTAIKKRLGFSQSIYLLPCYEIYFSLFDSWLAIKNLTRKRVTWK